MMVRLKNRLDTIASSLIDSKRSFHYHGTFHCMRYMLLYDRYSTAATKPESSVFPTSSSFLVSGQVLFTEIV